MLPEAALVVVLLVAFFADLFMAKSETKAKTMGYIVNILLLGVIAVCAFAEPTSAFGGMYVTTPMVNVMKVILTLGTLIVTIMAQPWIDNSSTRLVGEFHTLVLSTLLGMFVMMSSGHFLLFFLGLEMASVPMACLVAFDKRKKQSAEAAAKYILTATFSSGVMLYGISFIYGATGAMYFTDIVGRISHVIHNEPMLVMGLVFFFSGLGFKISLVPFHFWTADTYQGAPTPITGYLSVVSKGAATITLFVILQKVFGVISEYWYLMLGIVIVLSITVGNLLAMRQKELKRFMAFSSISQAGYIMLAALSADPQMGATALTYYVLIYVVANMAVFTVINVVEHSGGRVQSSEFSVQSSEVSQPSTLRSALPLGSAKNSQLTQMSAYNGFYQTNPRLAFLMTVALFSLAGIPPFAGMFSKFFVFMAAAQQGSFMAYFVVFVALVNTVVSLYYYLLIVKAMYIKKTTTPLPAFQSDINSRLALALCTAGIVGFGILSCVYTWIQASAV
jgi:NADH-quinone oxidoreductase subunit N